MPTAKHRIAAYLPLEVNEKFQAFKEERGVGDSQALILILSEFLEVSHLVGYFDQLNVDALKSELLSELDIRFSELKSELLGELRQKDMKDMKAVELDVAIALVSEHQSTTAQLAERFSCRDSLIRKQKNQYKDTSEKFVAWSKSRDPEGLGWMFDERVKLFVRVDGNLAQSDRTSASNRSH